MKLIRLSRIVKKGSGIGKKLGLPPTMNFSLRRVPKTLKFGIYCVRVKTPVGEFPGVMHYGPRPAVAAPLSLEVHAIGLTKKLIGRRVTIEIGARIRAVKNFKTVAELKRAIKNDISRTFLS